MYITHIINLKKKEARKKDTKDINNFQLFNTLIESH